MKNGILKLKKYQYFPLGQVHFLVNRTSIIGPERGILRINSSSITLPWRTIQKNNHSDSLKTRRGMPR